jgi:hypothetical protein
MASQFFFERLLSFLQGDWQRAQPSFAGLSEQAAGDRRAAHSEFCVVATRQFAAAALERRSIADRRRAFVAEPEAMVEDDKRLELLVPLRVVSLAS